MLFEHRGEVEFDFLNVLHTDLQTVVARDPEEVWRLLALLAKRPGSLVHAVRAKWDHPLSLEAIVAASLYTAWTGAPHPLMPDTQDRTLSDVERRTADAALEQMNRPPA